jgi:HK97 family phage major capsid protein
MKKVALLGLMSAHFAAFSARMAEGGDLIIEIREDQTLGDLAKTIEKIGLGFEEYKKTNDERLDQIAKKGVVDPTTEAKLAKLDKDLDALTDLKRRLESVETRGARPGGEGGRHEQPTKEAQDYKEAFLDWLRAPSDLGRQQKAQAARSALESRANASPLERRATQVVTSTGSAGGFALPEEIERTIARLQLDLSPIRQIATVRQVSTTDYKELFDVNGAAFEWVPEAGARSQTDTPNLAEVVPTMGTASARPRASEESLDDLFFDVESWLQQSVAEALAVGEGAAFIGGNGTNRPTGILAGPTPVATVDASRAFGTLQYIASGQASALPTSADTFIDMVYSLRARYRANARWLTSKAILAALRKYKDSTGQYLWQASLSQAQPETFMGYPISEAEDMPAVAAGTFPLAFGDFKEGYLIVDRVGTRVTRDDITVPGFVQWYVRRRVGGKLRNTQAIKLLKVAAS